MKVCSLCKHEKAFEEFDKNCRTSDGHEVRCKSCRKIQASKKYREDPFLSLARTKKSECKKKGIPFDLDADYLREIWTGICPISGVKITIGNQGCGSHRSGHLDRFKPEVGYLKGNVHYLSGRMNRIKYDATIEELRSIADWMERQERATTIPSGSTPQAYGGGNGENVS